ncbi:hypothetical protein AVEN_273109-1 [Araneus ventricosus]|uniref:Uncharacterized protein n=1 Tax=Araneus ventricosus TaxID=182803 RepID=A0A4Y2TV29_ARAVE|nr:hypothetical protein AVEN_273109-1 [Araneus ventricosus]
MTSQPVGQSMKGSTTLQLWDRRVVVLLIDENNFGVSSAVRAGQPDFLLLFDKTRVFPLVWCGNLKRWCRIR